MNHTADRYILKYEQVQEIQRLATKADRIELIPTKDGTFHICIIKREKIASLEQ